MRLITFFIVTGMLGVLTSCGNYSLTVNERLVYDPPGIFTDFRLPDLELQRCADDSIAEEKITAANELESLLCPAKDIDSLKGIALFDQLKRLGLERNHVNNLQPLAKLTNLEQLNLAGNNLTDISALHVLTKLQYLNLSDNPELNCQQLNGIKLVKNGKLLAPDHCGRSFNSSTRE